MKLLTVICAVCLTFVFAVCAGAEEAQGEIIYKTNSDEQIQTEINGQIDILELDKLDKNLKNRPFSITKALRSFISGDIKLRLDDVLDFLKEITFGEVAYVLYIVKNALIVTLLSALLKSLSSSFLSKSTGELSFFVCYAALAYSTFAAFNIALDTATQTAGYISDFAKVAFPAVFSVAALSGEYVSASVALSLALGACAFAADIMLKVIIPLVSWAAVIEFVNNISDRSMLSRFAELIKKSAVWLLRLLVIGYAGLMSLKGIAAPALNGFFGKAIKAAIGSAPIVGDIINGVLDVSAGAATALKGASEAVFIIFVIAYCVRPVIRLAVIGLVFKASSAIAEPFCEERLLKSLETAAELSFILAGTAVAACFMLIISIIGVMGIF